MNETTTKGKKGFWGAFFNFLAMGGFMVILILGAAIAVFISYLINK